MKTIISLGVTLLTIVNVTFASNGHFKFSNAIYANYNAATPLCVAISKGETELVKKFVAYGADVNERSNGMTPLMVAARYNQTEIIKFLISKGANQDAKDERGFTALKYAEWSKATEAATLLKSL